jgi:hypothetical protein
MNPKVIKTTKVCSKTCDCRIFENGKWYFLLLLLLLCGSCKLFRFMCAIVPLIRDLQLTFFFLFFSIFLIKQHCAIFLFISLTHSLFCCFLLKNKNNNNNSNSSFFNNKSFPALLFAMHKIVLFIFYFSFVF